VKAEVSLTVSYLKTSIGVERLYFLSIMYNFSDCQEKRRVDLFWILRGLLSSRSSLRLS